RSICARSAKLVACQTDAAADASASARSSVASSQGANRSTRSPVAGLIDSIRSPSHSRLHWRTWRMPTDARQPRSGEKLGADRLLSFDMIDRIVIGCMLLLAAAGAAHAAPDAQAQRDAYAEAIAALRAGDGPRFRRHFARLDGYVLRGYAEFEY